ncbi:MAG TPA: site-specific integrase [Pseudomonas sp.]|uniref:tyrosine-type recombinase/integrase n=1 Tax=Pseudomonas sp. TaxID=306 RepID=UPI002EDA2135
MSSSPIPLFETYKRFRDLNFSRLSDELPVVTDYLLSFPPELKAQEGYLAARGFLKSYSNNEATFNSYRTHVERLLLWSLLIAKKPLLELKRHDCERFLEFCLHPSPEWIGPIVKSRFNRVGGRKAAETDTYIINEDWRPFNIKIDKQIRKVAEENNKDVEDIAYKMSAGSMGQVFAVCGSFYQYATDEGLTTEANPVRAVKQKSNFKQRNTVMDSGKALTPLQWNYVIETAEVMAEEDLRHERTLFIVATLFSLYLRVSDLVGRDNWQPTMGAFEYDGENWWFNVVGKGNKAAKISVRDEYIEDYLKRYRATLSLPPLPSHKESTPLVRTISGRGGLSDRHIRALIQMVFDRSLQRMKDEGQTDLEMDKLRSASLHWLRHTAATFDAPFRDIKDLQADLRHENMSTTQNTYYNSLDQKRAKSIKGLGIKDRG